MPTRKNTVLLRELEVLAGIILGFVRQSPIFLAKI
jgi:hypothetical protein